MVRESCVPFAVVRPTALTEEDAGAPLEFDQGDVIKVRLSCPLPHALADRRDESNRTLKTEKQLHRLQLKTSQYMCQSSWQPQAAGEFSPDCSKCVSCCRARSPAGT